MQMTILSLIIIAGVAFVGLIAITLLVFILRK
jgi:hypothetical protein